MNTHQGKALSSDEQPAVNRTISSVSISPDMRFVATAHLDTIIRIWDVATGSLADRLHGHTDSVFSVAFTPDSKGLVSGGLDRQVKYWELDMRIPRARKVGERLGRHVLDYSGNQDGVLSIALSQDGQWVASGSGGGRVQFWDKHGRAQLALSGHEQGGR